MSRDVLLELPSELAYELMEQEVVEPYVREDRVDPELVSSVVLAVSTAVSTVVATRLTEGVITSISRAVRSWFTRRDQNDRAELRSPAADLPLVIDANTTDEEIVAFIRRARGDTTS